MTVVSSWGPGSARLVAKCSMRAATWAPESSGGSLWWSHQPMRSELAMKPDHHEFICACASVMRGTCSASAPKELTMLTRVPAR